ncbi:ovarian-specific serine/threonine-protein kinase Lok-like [Ruditapes philippinarum]|uniref:ovarian-specific serine/threonine-protein kinase Lok-like n=1 Tax=Ruditapes philippinarum TaxID=129788 RepID=UPI00295BBAC6|nr:ovarian-specific serine/threonine-protein kinase Lok-like [Ruditapes philippinarum]
MAFKVPVIPRLVQPLKQPSKLQSECLGLPSINIDALKLTKTIGSGNFGKVSLYHHGESYVIMKEMLGDSEDHERLFVKEAKLLNTIKHPNIVQFKGIVKSDEKTAFLMEYIHFDLTPFGNPKNISNLNQLKTNLDASDYAGFEHFQIIIAEDICKGLSFLHKNNIVHRDLKPDNVLVSNQHCLGKQDIDKFWMEKPVIAKLSDFGESRSLLVQTNSLIHTRTDNVNRGTPVYIAPEIHLDSTKANTLDELKSMDIWSMAMIFYSLLNPNTRYVKSL